MFIKIINNGFKSDFLLLLLLNDFQPIRILIPLISNSASFLITSCDKTYVKMALTNILISATIYRHLNPFISTGLVLQ